MKDGIVATVDHVDNRRLRLATAAERSAHDLCFVPKRILHRVYYIINSF